MNDQEIKNRLEKSVVFFEENLRKLRTGRANTTLLENVKVQAYETVMPLIQLANISVVDFKTMTVQPWDKANIEAIMKGIGAANIGLTPVRDEDIIRVHVPDLTEERRKEITKVVGTYEEEAKVALRQVRKEIIESFKNDKEATEDDVKYITDKLDKFIREYNDQVTKLADAKRTEMMAV
jgi:ribosome recycling factor